MLPVWALTHNCEQMCFFGTDGGYRCSSARKTAVISVQQEELRAPWPIQGTPYPLLYCAARFFFFSHNVIDEALMCGRQGYCCLSSPLKCPKALPELGSTSFIELTLQWTLYTRGASPALPSTPPSHRLYYKVAAASANTPLLLLFCLLVYEIWKGGCCTEQLLVGEERLFFISTPSKFWATRHIVSLHRM